jgi:hypothetical protein
VEDAAGRAQDGTAAATAKRTSIPLVFGILSIIFASIGLLGGLANGCSAFSGQGMGGAGGLAGERGGAAMSEMFAAMDALYLGIGLQGLVLLLFSPALLAIGIGQVRYRRWARAWSVRWGAAALAGLVFLVLVALLVIGPAYQRFFDVLRQRMGAGGVAAPLLYEDGIGSMFASQSISWLVLCYAPYPVLLLVFFSRTDVKQSMTE